MPASTIYLVRHGQASAKSRDYDVLSALGVQQARRLGAYLGGERRVIEVMVSGPRKRQIDTARHLVEAAHAAGMSYPAPVIVDELDEMPFREILNAALHHWIDEGPHMGAMLRGEPHIEYSFVRLRAFIKRAVMAWAAEELVAEGTETFARFAERVEGAIERLQQGGGAVMAVTSAGPVALSLRHARARGTESAHETMALAMEIVNASVSTLVSDGTNPLRVAAANQHDHLDPDAVTLV